VLSLAWRSGTTQHPCLFRQHTGARAASTPGAVLGESSFRTRLSAPLGRYAIVGTCPARENLTMDGQGAAITDWWSELDAVTSLLGRLAQEGTIAIRRVARTSG